MKWPMVKLEELATHIRNGVSVKQSPNAGGLKITRIETIAERKVNLNKCGYADLTENDYMDFRLKKGDILISHINSESHLGKCAIFEEERNDIVHGMNLLSFRTNRKVEPKYLYYALSSDSFLMKLKKITKKSVNQASFNVTSFKELDIPLPPLEEQKRIAAILDKADAIRQKRQQAIALADDFLRSAFLDMFGDPVTNPKGWEVIKLGSCCRFQGGFAFKSEDYCDSGIPLVKITNVHFENIDWSDVSYVPADFLDTKAEFALKDEDLVMAMTRPIIKSLNAVKVIEVKEMDLPCLLNQRVGRFIDYENSFKKHFLKYLLYSDFFMNKVEKLCSVALQPNISAKQIEAITCYIPPIELQDEFSQIAKQIEQTIPHMSSFNDLDLFGSLNSKAFSGQL